MARLRFTLDFADFVDRDMVIEAVVESLEVKKAIFRDLDAIVAPSMQPAWVTDLLSGDRFNGIVPAPTTPTELPKVVPGSIRVRVLNGSGQGGQEEENEGRTREELIEAVTQLAFYAGWPNAVSAVGVAREVLPQR